MNTLIAYMKGLFGSSEAMNSEPSESQPPEQAIWKMAKKICRHDPAYVALMRDSDHGTRKAEEFYVGYIEEIKTLVPRERLLVMNVKEGWQPLCTFLGKDVPQWQFPKANSREEFEANRQAIEKLQASKE